jgi:hypothetical protein
MPGIAAWSSGVAAGRAPPNQLRHHWSKIAISPV